MSAAAEDEAMTILEDDEDTELLLLDDTLADVTPTSGRPAKGSLDALPAGVLGSPVVVTDVAVADAEVVPPADLSFAPGGAQLA
jgi:hypothetical protein